MKQFELSRTLFGADIIAQIIILNNSVHVLLTGGNCSHVGAVALAQDGKLLSCVSFPGHREQAVCVRWATGLSNAIGKCATVACGIHYDRATPVQIEAILRVCDELLFEILQSFQKWDDYFDESGKTAPICLSMSGRE